MSGNRVTFALDTPGEQDSLRIRSPGNVKPTCRSWNGELQSEPLGIRWYAVMTLVFMDLILSLAGTVCRMPGPGRGDDGLPECIRLAPNATHSLILDIMAVTVAVIVGFLCAKIVVDSVRSRWTKITVIIVGGGPIGLLSALIAAKSNRVQKIIFFEEKHKSALLNRPQQIALDAKSVRFLKNMGVDFDNIEGCWNDNCFFTRIGVFQEYLLDIINQVYEVEWDIRLGRKFTKDSLKELDGVPGRLLAIVCDGTDGHSARWLGLSDEFMPISCKSYGAVAAIERPEQRQVPTPEIKVHGLTFDLTAFNHDYEDEFPINGFHFKIFGSVRNRYMALSIPKCESKMVRTLKVVLDKSIMRSIFQQCFNRYKNESESKINDNLALKSLKFSPRLFEIKISKRLESAVFIEDANIFVITEGDASRCVNFHSGMDINLGIRGLQSLHKFVRMAATAATERSILGALRYKSQHSNQVVQEYLKQGLRESMYT
ncbi:uncharacterized protein LOC135496080 isoform X1 [Lineus longissimus]|uniref:uncharacterized protein LOC135496080 isoform X1 n=1 Tax=Lineus longissimus TaxID=88925 RepID=UPI00315D34EB